MVLASMPWRRAFREDLALPSGVMGPLERAALRRLAASFRGETGVLLMAHVWGMRGFLGSGKFGMWLVGLEIKFSAEW
jgi:hypothetical protein